jgi:SAM-dependent methyltransferase
MARHRLANVPGARPEQVQQGSVLDIPCPDASFDLFVAIGYLHHTGDLSGAIQEVRRVLRPGGGLVIMVYNRRSLRRIVSAARVPAAPRPAREGRRAGAGPLRLDDGRHPRSYTDFVIVPELRGLLHDFKDIRVERRNTDGLPIPYMAERSRSALMAVRADRLIGLDLYVTARR